MPKKIDFMDLTRDEIEEILWRSYNDQPKGAQAEAFQAMLKRRDGLVNNMRLCRECEQIKIEWYPWKYCYVTCTPRSGFPVSELRPEKEAELRVFDSSPTTRMMAMKREEWTKENQEKNARYNKTKNG